MGRRRQRCQEVNAKGAKNAGDAKKKPQIAQISTDFFCEICGFNRPIGVNLCQSVDNKGAKDEKNTDYTD